MTHKPDKPGMRHARHTIHKPVLIRCLRRQGQSSELIQATLTDFSYSGARIACDFALGEHEEVGMRLVCSGEEQGEIVVVTRWSRQLEGGRFHHGVQFVDEGALLPFLGLDKADYASRWEPSQAGPGVLLVPTATRVSRIERLHCIVRGDLAIDQGLSEANLIVEGQLNVTGGSVIGGETSASMRMNLSQAGDSDATPTRLRLAFLTDEIADVRTRANLHLDNDLAHVADCKNQIESFNGDDGVPSHDNREEVMALMFEMQAKEASVEQLKEKINLLDGLISRKTCGELSVREVLHCGVQISLFGKPERYEPTQTLTGPVFIRADEAGVLLMATDDGQELPLDQCDTFRRCA